MPKVIFSNSFIYDWHIGSDDLLAYYERPAAFYPKSAAEHSPYYDMYDYMANNEKSDGVFTADNDRLSTDEVEQYRDYERISKKDGCPKYIQVVSFDNSFLEQNHIMVNGIVDKQKLRNVFREAMATLIEKEPKLEPANCYWTAAIHTNTDNIHIHSSLLEYHRLEDRTKKYRDGDLLSVQAMNKLKSVIASKLIETNERTKEHTKIERELLLPSLKKTFTHTTEQMMELRRILPSEGGWQYNRPKMKRYRPHIDAVVDNIIKSNEALNRQFEQYKASLESLAEYYKAFYGEGKHSQYLCYTANKLDEFYSRAGNSLLKSLAEIDISYKQGHKFLKEGAITSAEEKLKIAADRKDEKAEYELGKLYLTYYTENTEKTNEGVLFLEKLAQKDNVNALYVLGVRYLSEKKMENKGIEYLKRAADEHDFEAAQYLLGKYYYEKGKLQNSTKYLSLAAEKNNSFAYYKLGQVHSRLGQSDKAMLCYHRASVLGNEYAARYLSEHKEASANWNKKAAAQKQHYRIRTDMSRAVNALKAVYQQSEQHLRQLQREFEYENNIINEEATIDYSI